MAAIYLVRHGQAGFDKLDYDQLSSLGHQQANLVGNSLATRHIENPITVFGAMRRHRETMTGAQSNWKTLSEMIELSEFNEFDSDDLIACAHKQFANKLELGTWLLAQANKRKAFQELFATAVERWTSGQHDDDYFESWNTFTTRVLDGLKKVIAQANGNDVVIFTSGGPITVIAQYCLALSNAKAFEMNWTLLNGGITQLLYSRTGKISLASFNEHQHLATAGKQFLTYR